MDIEKAYELTQTLIATAENNHGLKSGLMFRFDRAKRRLGSYRPKSRCITLSGYITTLNSKSVVEEVIRHEIAHALAHEHDQHLEHGEPWKKWAKIMGANPRASCQPADVVTPKAPYAYTCPRCDFKAERYRRPSHKQKRAGCPKCSNDSFFQPLQFGTNTY